MATLGPEWILDSCATQHVTPWKEGLLDLWPMQGKILIGDNLTVLVCGIGDLDLILDGRGGMYTSQVLYVPHDGFHLLSVKELHELGLQVAFDVDQLRVRHGNSRSLICEGRLQR